MGEVQAVVAPLEHLEESQRSRRRRRRLVVAGLAP